MNMQKNAELKELSTSNYQIAESTPDITGWMVAGEENRIIGQVKELLFDQEDARVRYMIVELHQGETVEKRVIIPVGVAERHKVHSVVMLPGIGDTQIQQLPAYPGLADLNAEHELEVRRILEGGSTAPYLHPQFYQHLHFDEDKFFNGAHVPQVTDLSAEESPEKLFARAERTRRIVARLDHHDQMELTNQQTNNIVSTSKQIPMENSENAIGVINDLIEINNDRVEGFEKAARDLEDPNNGLIVVFNKLAAESQQYVAELTDIVQRFGGEPTEGSSTSGALHRAWLDVKSVFTGGDAETILNECERGEDAIKAAYASAIDPDNELNPEVLQVLQIQLQGISEGHDLIKSLRDQANAVDDNEEEVEDTTMVEDQYQDEAIASEPSYEGAAGEYNQRSAAAYAPEPENIEQEEAWQEESTSTADSKLMEFFINELQDLLWAERELVETLPEIAEAATSQELKNAFDMHLSETRTHVSRLEQIFGILGLEPESRKCEAMAGILDEGDEIISATEEGTAQRDVGLIFAGQKVEHYEIASYGGMIALAKTLGYYDIAETLVLTLDEEKTADAKLTDIAESQANYAASTEQAEN